MAVTDEEYIDYYLGVLDGIKDTIQPKTGSAVIKTRYITSKMPDEEKWIGALRSKSNGKANIWLITLTGSKDGNSSAVGTIQGKVQVLLEYYFDYELGTDAENSEKTFMSSVLKVNLALLRKKNCLISSKARLEDVEFAVRLRSFSTGTTHKAQFLIKLTIGDIIL